MTRVAVAAALVGFAVPALACDAMKTAHASTASSSTKADEKAKTEKEAKEAKKSEKKQAVASAEAKR